MLLEPLEKEKNNFKPTSTQPEDSFSGLFLVGLGVLDVLKGIWEFGRKPSFADLRAFAGFCGCFAGNYGRGNVKKDKFCNLKNIYEF